jgi:uncharacterized protein (DUF1778 family)
MACFSDLPYANWSYQLLITLNNAVVEGEGPVSLGCYAAMNSSEQAYQFYKVLNQLMRTAQSILTQNCFVQLTDAQQWGALNDALADPSSRRQTTMSRSTETRTGNAEGHNRDPNGRTVNPQSNYR